MFQFLFRTQRTLIPCSGFGLIYSKTQLGFLPNTFSITRLLSLHSHVKSRISEVQENEEKRSFTVSYFMNSCGLSSSSASVVAKRVNVKNKEKADSVLRLLRNHGFTNNQISKVVRSCPRVIQLDPERILLPKIEFFRFIGFSTSDLTKVISSSPCVLATSLENRLIPNYNLLKSILILDEKVVRLLKRPRWGFLRNFSTYLEPNIALLKTIGVTQSRISYFVINDPFTATSKHSKFHKVVNEVKEMGFNPLKMTFLFAMQVISQLKKSTWESKIGVYRRWGWSKDKILAAFKRHPFCMIISEEKITKAMDFFVNQMSWLSQDIAKRPQILLYSLEMRIVPRCSVVQILLSKGLIRKDLSPSTFLMYGERKFVERYVTKFQEKVPQLLNVYKGKLNVLDLRPGSKRYKWKIDLLDVSPGPESEGMDVDSVMTPKTVTSP